MTMKILPIAVYVLFSTSSSGTVLGLQLNCTGYEDSNNNPSSYAYLQMRGGGQEGNWRVQNRNSWPAEETCESTTVAPRGTYTADYKLCTIKFYSNDGSASQRNGFELSDACENPGLEVNTTTTTALREYVLGWNDQCVGDYERCYTVDQHQHIYRPLFCHYKWPLSDDITHIGMDCRADKSAKMEEIAKMKNGDTMNDDMMMFDPGEAQFEKKMEDEQNKQMRHIIIALSVTTVTLICCCCCLLGICHRFFWSPYLAALGHHNRDPSHIAETDGLFTNGNGDYDDTMSSDDDAHASQQHKVQLA